ncbi:lipopolysaccharide heptosyltransferase II [Campylobacter sp. MIT 12-8780]|uniref:lipopolysaccharide heptosyltransferase II n=1 Tax=unclassified Campylobacter TaxID=2593542 RepID=UPI00115ECC4C|nr:MULTISPECIES: lipopolysaccharide heptosyltransferase II [unclassified Campylobacter]NDJ26786.1 lipopolysaccharide heptosyltransferase II [Campylobacter sp. MIT 19-121]TQR42393.1 lipopolysaccharide heptosyltransferase II [Campylobacter sp. MIT 12-8780]
MKIFIHLPTWLGDAVMASAALKLVFEYFTKLDKKAEFILHGSFVACELFKECENTRIFIEDKKSRYLNFYKLTKILGRVDYAFSFRGAFSAKIMLFLLHSRHKFIFDKKHNKNAHQVLKYLEFVKNSLKLKEAVQDELFLPIKAYKDLTKNEQKKLCEHFKLDMNKKFLGINAGAKYGSAKRWNEEYFAKVALEFSKSHEILIFGVASEQELCDKIELLLQKNGIKALNLCAKTSIKELCELISSLDLFISNDSGAMHVAAVYKTPTIAVFGPTKFTQTSPWHNENARLVHLNLACMPCMKRVCPLKHHACMQELKPELVIKEAKSLLKE